MLMYGLKTGEELFFQDKDIGIVIYDNLNKVIEFYKYSNHSFVWKSDLILIIKIENVLKNDIFSKLYELTENNLLKRRSLGPMNRCLELFAGYSDGTVSMFSKSEKFLSLCEVESVESVILEVVDTFNLDESRKEIDKLKEKKEFKDNEFYAFWNIKEDKISSSFIFSHLLQTKMCFGDFGKSYLKEGSLFLKLRLKD